MSSLTILKTHWSMLKKSSGEFLVLCHTLPMFWLGRHWNLHPTVPAVLSMMSAMTLVGRTRTFVISHLESVSTEFAGETVTMPENGDILTRPFKFNLQERGARQIFRQQEVQAEGEAFLHGGCWGWLHPLQRRPKGCLWLRQDWTVTSTCLLNLIFCDINLFAESDILDCDTATICDLMNFSEPPVFKMLSRSARAETRQSRKEDIKRVMHSVDKVFVKIPFLIFLILFTRLF